MNDSHGPVLPPPSALLPRGWLERTGDAPREQSGRFGDRRIEVAWARHQDEVRQAQRLRFDVFATEMGARLHTPEPGYDIDFFDDYCEHLLVRDVPTRQVVGTYRVLTPAQAQRVGCTYSDTEFDLIRLRALRAHTVELGRSCVHPEHRHGGVILALWGGAGRFHGAQPAAHHDRLRQHSHGSPRRAQCPCGRQYLAATAPDPPGTH